MNGEELPPNKKIAVVLLSGGLDSATTLAYAIQQGYECHALSFDYGQRHDAELNAAKRVAKSMGINDHRIVALPGLGEIGGSALTDKGISVPHAGAGKGIPVTYVPARNTLFLSFALAWAEVIKAGHIFIGVNAVDYSGYPDCRPEFIEAFSRMANLATRSAVSGNPIEIHTPLIALSKQEIILRGIDLGVDYSMTVSCYDADASGLACGLCESCRFRAEGFIEAKIPDPTHYQNA